MCARSAVEDAPVYSKSRAGTVCWRNRAGTMTWLGLATVVTPVRRSAMGWASQDRTANCVVRTVRAYEGIPGVQVNAPASIYSVPLCVAWLYGTLVLAGRRSGYVIVLLFSLLSLAAPYFHIMVGRGVGIGSRTFNSSGAFFFIWTMIALGVTGLFSVILSARGLWMLRRGQPGSPTRPP